MMAQIVEKRAPRMSAFEGGLERFASLEVQLNDEDHAVLALEANGHPPIAFQVVGVIQVSDVPGAHEE